MRRSASSWKRRRTRRKRARRAFGAKARSPWRLRAEAGDPMPAACAAPVCGECPGAIRRALPSLQDYGHRDRCGDRRRAAVRRVAKRRAPIERVVDRGRGEADRRMADRRRTDASLARHRRAPHERFSGRCGMSAIGRPRQDAMTTPAARFAQDRTRRQRRRGTLRPGACLPAAAGFRGRPGSAWTACRSAARRHRRR